LTWGFWIDYAEFADFMDYSFIPGCADDDRTKGGPARVADSVCRLRDLASSADIGTDAKTFRSPTKRNDKQLWL